MRRRALLFFPALAATMLGISAGDVSAATLFTNINHATRVSVSSTADATSVGPIDFTDTTGLLLERCSHSNLRLTVDRNDMTSGVDITVTNGTISPGCSGLGGGNLTVTTTTPWKLTITGNGTPSGGNTVFAAAIHNVAVDMPNIGPFTGNLTTGVTASQATGAGSPICIIAAAAGTIAAVVVPARVDARYCFTGPAATWSLTN